MQFCKFETVDFSSLRNMKHLRSLEFSCNDLLANVNALDGLHRLRVLDLSNCRRLSNLDVGELQQLDTLLLDGCGFTAFPRGVTRLHRLRSLGLSDNQLDVVPDLSAMTSLRDLCLQGNDMQSAVGVHSLVNLVTLDVNQNLSLVDF